MRYITPFIAKDLQKKMVFLGGPRQSGKTTLAESILKQSPGGKYFSWDDDQLRRSLIKQDWSDEDRLLIFDELHKFPKWKNWVKGVFDKSKSIHQILVTGSARLDVYRRGGDSLLGRYHYWRLHPFTLSEIPSGISKQEAFHRLMNVGGFPEPFLANDETDSRRWRRERLQRVLREDVRDLEAITKISSLMLFVDILLERVGTPIVLSNIANDLEVAPKTLKAWLFALERMYLLFVVPPFTQKLTRLIKKPPKVYFFDNADVVGDEGARFENLVATSLLKRIHFLEDRDGFNFQLSYLRDKSDREVDFVITKEKVVTDLVEAKWKDSQLSKSLIYYSEKLKVPSAIQIVSEIEKPWTKGPLKLRSALDCLTEKETDQKPNAPSLF